MSSLPVYFRASCGHTLNFVTAGYSATMEKANSLSLWLPLQLSPLTQPDEFRPLQIFSYVFSLLGKPFHLFLISFPFRIQQLLETITILPQLVTIRWNFIYSFAR